MLPTRGTCHGVFLLVHSARTSAHRSHNQWIATAKEMPTIMAAAVDLDAIACFLRESRLVTFDDSAVHIDSHLRSIGEAVTDDVLMQIATLLLCKAPPTWLHGALVDGNFYPEWVPSTALTALQWLDDALEPILSTARVYALEDEAFRCWLGRVGEALVMAIEQASGALARQVSLISDSFGYDIDSRRASRFRIEVKTSVKGSEHRVFVTRNEVNAALKYVDEWSLIQVVLTPDAITSDNVKGSHVEKIRLLTREYLLAVLPRDSKDCRWIESVELKTDNLPWQRYASQDSIPEGWSFPRMSAP